MHIFHAVRNVVIVTIQRKADNLNVREWICSKCGCENDRDINTSINIMFEGLRMHYQRKLV